MNSFLRKSGLFCLTSWVELDSAPIHFNGICYHKNSILIGEDAFLDFYKSDTFDFLSEGRFTVAYPLKEKPTEWIISNDESGQGLLFYYQHGEKWAVSNSFLYLAEYLRKKSIKLSFNPKTILGFSALHSTTEQPVSHSTLVKEIKLLSYKSYIKIDKNKFEIIKKPSIEIHDYIEGLINFKNTWVSRLSALSEKFSDNISCDLTGGYDSRTIFGLLLASEVDLSKINIRSNRNQLDDFRVANKISQHYGFKLNTGSFKHKVPCSNELAFELWKYGNIGIYFPVYFQINDYSQTENIHLHGAGGEGLRGIVNDSTPQQLANRLAKKIVPAQSSQMITNFKNEFLVGAKEAGFNKDQLVDHTYYNFYRSRYHFGRNNFRSLYTNLITPLNSMYLHSLKDSLPKDSFDTQIYSDLMLLCDQQLPSFDFDDVNRNFSKDQIGDSSFYKKSYPVEFISINVNSKNISCENRYIENNTSSEEIMCAELEKHKQLLLELNFTTNVEFEKIIQNISSKENLTQSLKQASYLLSIAEVKLLCSD